MPKRCFTGSCPKGASRRTGIPGSDGTENGHGHKDVPRYLPLAVKRETEREIARKVDDAIFLSGTSYSHHVLSALGGGTKVRYSKDIDFFTADFEKAVLTLGYPERETGSRTWKGANRKKMLDAAFLMRDGCRMQAYICVDVDSARFYTDRCPDKERSLDSLKRNAVDSGAFGVRVSGINDLVAAKLMNIKRGRRIPGQTEKPPNPRDAADVANLSAIMRDGIDWEEVQALMGGKEQLRAHLGLAREALREYKMKYPDMRDEVLYEILEEQAAEPDDVSYGILLVDFDTAISSLSISD